MRKVTHVSCRGMGSVVGCVNGSAYAFELGRKKKKRERQPPDINIHERFLSHRFTNKDHGAVQYRGRIGRISCM